MIHSVRDITRGKCTWLNTRAIHSIEHFIYYNLLFCLLILTNQIVHILTITFTQQSLVSSSYSFIFGI